MQPEVITDAIYTAIESELQKQVARLRQPYTSELYAMLSYHMGWTGELSGPDARGKRLRPLLLLLSANAYGQDWLPALPAAAAVELVHNFSLVHDDIQDNSSLRRGRTTVWKKWGMAQGINAGDSLFVLANMAMEDIQDNFSGYKVHRARNLLLEACLELTRGQYLDMTFEALHSLDLDDYWLMVGGKTASLFQACCKIGSLLGNANSHRQELFGQFGHYLGLVFQIRDDILGIWGELQRIGKSKDSDLISRKKTLPIIYGIKIRGKFSRLWENETLAPEIIPILADALVEDGALLYSQQIMDGMSNMAFQSLRAANPQGEAGKNLYEILKQASARDY